MTHDATRSAADGTLRSAEARSDVGRSPEALTHTLRMTHGALARAISCPVSDIGRLSGERAAELADILSADLQGVLELTYGRTHDDHVSIDVEPSGEEPAVDLVFTARDARGREVIRRLSIAAQAASEGVSMVFRRPLRST